MNGLMVLFLLIFVAAIPIFLVYLWFRMARFPLSLPWALFFLLSGAAALFIALLLQNLLPAALPANSRLSAVIFNIFCKIALTEELGRLLMLLLFFKILRLMGKGIPPARIDGNTTDPVPGVFSSSAAVWGSVAGLLAGLGFALIESASYGAADMGVTLLRAFTAAPLHGACGARVGAAAAVCRDHPLPALMRFLSAVAIHGMYNFMILLPGTPTVLAIFIALSAAGSSVLFIHGALRGSPAGE
jgi:RsiW-degrading membrane proteinase PrsW (M82 family)